MSDGDYAIGWEKKARKWGQAILREAGERCSTNRTVSKG